jgi:hypothetical protein
VGKDITKEIEMPKQITAWQCEYCSRYRIAKSAITRHEEICFENPNRKILKGQLAIFETMPRELIITDSYGVPNSEWQEPNWFPPDVLSKKYKWWPRNDDGSLGLGFIYTGDKWEKIEGYEEPHFAPGYSWKNETVPDKLRL